MNAAIFERIKDVFDGSDAAATRQLYTELTNTGPAGELAVNLMRACKKSERAKVYRGRAHRSSSYDGKAWAMGEVCRVLIANPGLVPAWGWGEDPIQEFHKWVLYVELPNGQASFHAEHRGEGPDYGKPWDGKTKVSATRVITFATHTLEAQHGSKDQP